MDGYGLAGHVNDDSSTGFSMLIRREVVDAVGGFDIRFRHGAFVKHDFRNRALLAGFRISIDEDAFTLHPNLTDHADPAQDQLFHESLFQFMDKWNMSLPEDGDYTQWTATEIPNQPFDPLVHYSPLIADYMLSGYMQHASELFAKKQFLSCEAVLKQCMARHGEQHIVRYNLLVNYMQTKNTEKASECFEYLDENMVEVGNLKVIWLMWMNRRQEAQQLLKGLIQRHPGEEALFVTWQYVNRPNKS